MSAVVNLIGVEFIMPPMNFTCADPLFAGNVTDVIKRYIYETHWETNLSVALIMMCYFYSQYTSSFNCGIYRAKYSDHVK